MALSSLTVMEIQNNHDHLIYEAFEEYGRWSWWLSIQHPSGNQLKNKLLVSSDFLYGSEEEAIQNAKEVVKQILNYNILNDSPDSKQEIRRKREKEEDLAREMAEKEAWEQKNKK